MSAVELAVKKVKKLSVPQARELLGWLEAREANGTAVKKRSAQPWWRKGTPRQRMEKLKAWQDSVRLATDWEPPECLMIWSNRFGCELCAGHERGQRNRKAAPKS